jgi:hypothetical protein
MWNRGGSLEEMMALELIEDLIKSRLLHGLTFCETCKVNWVFRRGKKGKYCSRECRQAPYEASPKRKALKAIKNKEYYQRWLKRQRRIKRGKK